MSFSRDASSSNPRTCRSSRRARVATDRGAPARAPSARAAATYSRKAGVKIWSRESGVSVRSAREEPHREGNAATDPCAEQHGIAGGLDARHPRIDTELQHQRVRAVQGGLRDAADAHITFIAEGDRRSRARAQLVDRARVEQGEMPRALATLERAECGEQCVDFGDRERRLGECGALATRVLQVALHSHRPEEEPSDGDARRVGDQTVLEHAHASRTPDARSVAGPPQRGGSAGAVARGETDALVLRVREQMDDALRARVEIDLHRVARRIAEEARLIARVCGRVVEPGLGKREHGADRRGRRRELRQQHEGGEDHGPVGERVSVRSASG